MARKAKSSNEVAPRFGARSHKPRPVLSLIPLIVSVLVGIALADFHPNQTGKYDTGPVESESGEAGYFDDSSTNVIGQFGVWVGEYTTSTIGIAAFLLPACTLWLAYMFFRPFSHKINLRKAVLLLLLLTGATVFAAMAEPAMDLRFPTNYFPFGWGGWIGFHLYGQFLEAFFGLVGSLVIFSILTIFALSLLLFDNVIQDLRLIFGVKINEWSESHAAWKKRRAEKKLLRENQKKAKEQQKKLAKKAAEAKAAAKARSEEEKKKTAAAKKSAAPKESSDEQPQTAPNRKLSFLGRKAPPTEAPKPTSTAAPFAPIVEDADGPKPTPAKKQFPKPSKKDEPEPEPDLRLESPPAKIEKEIPPSESPGVGLRIIASEQTRKAQQHMPDRKGNYVFPPLGMLPESIVPDNADDATVHQETANSLIQTLDEFGVKVTPGEVHTGPVITRYDVFPAPGVRVEKIVNLDKNIALGLKAMSVRILAPVPGKGCVGIEVPNKSPQAVYIRDILESEDWANSKAEIPIALGKEVSGRPLITDLTKMPHLLIAGATGSGKTVCINSIICSLLYKMSPEDLRFVMVDPKIVEMQVYNNLPHMLVPVVTEPKKVPNALKYLLNEMEHRYQTFAQVGVRNIAGYNAKMAKDRKKAAEAEAEMEANLTPEERAAQATFEVPRDSEVIDRDQLPTKLPYIICVVDELADLMMVAPADIETGISRLAQLARAAGIHLILATQRPSVNVITGVIKANLPSRIAFKVASKVDSRTILDCIGADHLIGKGDMLFLPPGSAELVRAQGAFVDDDEIAGIVHHICEKNGEPIFDEQFQRNIESSDSDENGDSGEAGDFDDEMVPKAIEVIKTTRRASTSMLQRRLKIGYNRAARIMDTLEEEGIVGPDNGSMPRDILIDTDE